MWFGRSCGSGAGSTGSGGSLEVYCIASKVARLGWGTGCGTHAIPRLLRRGCGGEDQKGSPD